VSPEAPIVSILSELWPLQCMRIFSTRQPWACPGHPRRAARIASKVGPGPRRVDGPDKPSHDDSELAAAARSVHQRCDIKGLERRFIAISLRPRQASTKILSGESPNISKEKFGNMIFWMAARQSPC
jgi:hypothetical protein